MNVGERDQFQSALNDLATILRDHFQRMLQAGFSPSEALQLTINLQASILLNSQKGRG
jgi:hypothetical protein